MLPRASRIESGLPTASLWRFVLLFESVAFAMGTPQAGGAALLARQLPARRYHLRTPPFWDGLTGSYLQSFAMI